jgi:hypothetical protein
LATYVAGQQRTAAEHVARLAELGGCLARVDSDGKVSVLARPGGPPDVALRWGREIEEYRVLHLPDAAADLVLVGSGSAGAPDQDGALRPSTSALRGNADGPDARTVLRPTPLLRSASVAQTATAAAGDELAGRGQRLSARCFLQPALQPGTVVQVADVPDGLEGGPWLVRSISHRLTNLGDGSTVLEADNAAASSPGGSGLFAAAAAAVGSLL